jgi:hypothetical protein
MLNSQFLHIPMAGGLNHVRLRPRKPRTVLLEQNYLLVHIDLLCFGQVVPPRLEFLRVFYIPFHARNITFMEYNIKPRASVTHQELGADGISSRG